MPCTYLSLHLRFWSEHENQLSTNYSSPRDPPNNFLHLMLSSTSPQRSKSSLPSSSSSSSSMMIDFDGSTTTMSNPSTWTVQQVEEWLMNNNFDDCIDILCHQYQLDGQHLINIDENELRHLTENQHLWLQIKNLKHFYLTEAPRWSKRTSPVDSLLPTRIVPSDRRSASTHVTSSQSHLSSLNAVRLEVESSMNSGRQTPYDQIEDQPLTTCCLIISIRSDKKKTFFAFLLALSTIYFCSFIITIVDERLPDPKNFPPLPDLILDNIQQIPWAFAVTEKLILLEMFGLLLVVLLHRHR